MTVTGQTAHAAAQAHASWAFSVSLTLSVGAHFALFAWNPAFRVDDLGHNATELTAIDMPPEIEIPPPPAVIARPATPVIASTQIDEDITIAPTTFEANPVESLAAPPTVSASQAEDLRAAPRFTPYTVRPELKNPDAVRLALERVYPGTLRDAGISGTVLIWVFIDESGVVQRSLVKTSSGFPPFDAAALDVVPEMKFSPAINRDRRVPVWIELPLIFTSR